MPQLSSRLYVTNLFGTLFYLSCLLQWMWASLPYVPWIVRVAELLQPTTEMPTENVQVPAIANDPPSIVFIILACLIALIVLVVTIYILMKLPTTVAKSGQKITQNTSARIVPLITHHAKLTPQKRRRITARLIIYLKLIACSTPFILSALSFTLATDLDYTIILFIASLLGVGTFTFLGSQILFAKWLKIKPEDLW